MKSAYFVFQELTQGIYIPMARVFLPFPLRIALPAETLEAFVRDWLLLETCGVERVLKADIQLQAFHDIIIEATLNLLDDACPNHDIYKSVWPAIVFAV